MVKRIFWVSATQANNYFSVIIYPDFELSTSIGAIGAVAVSISERKIP